MSAGTEQVTPGGAGLHWRHVFRGDEAQIPELRRWLAGLLPDCATRDDVMTVAVELGTNAVRHTSSGHGGWFAVEVTWHHVAVRVAVADQGAPSGPRLMDTPDPLSETGRGLQVVRGLSARTGVTGGAQGRLVWAEITWSGPGAAGAAAFPDGYAAAIREGRRLLARRHAGVIAWFGAQTLQWWALTGRPGTTGLVAADTAGELAQLLDALDAAQPRTGQEPGRMAADDAVAARAGQPGTRNGHRRRAPVPPRTSPRRRSSPIGLQPC